MKQTFYFNTHLTFNPVSERVNESLNKGKETREWVAEG